MIHQRFFIHRAFRAVVMLVVVVGLSGCGNSNPEKQAQHFMTLLVSGKHLEAQEMLSKDMKSMATMFGGITNQSINDYYRSGHFKSFELTQLEKTENAVRYRVVAVTGDGKTHADLMDMVREDGAWKVSRF
jgi:hypothetical protein